MSINASAAGSNSSINARNLNTNNYVCGAYGSSNEPLHPSTRTFKRQLMERTVSDLLVRLDYTGAKLSETTKHCRVLQSLVLIKNEEIESLNIELCKLKRERQEIWAEYQDLNSRYQERSNEIRKK